MLSNNTSFKTAFIQTHFEADNVKDFISTLNYLLEGNTKLPASLYVLKLTPKKELNDYALEKLTQALTRKNIPFKIELNLHDQRLKGKRIALISNLLKKRVVTIDSLELNLMSSLINDEDIKNPSESHDRGW